MLHIPKLSTNLVSIKKLTQDLGCNVIFYSTHCCISRPVFRKAIGCAKEWNGLYHLETPSKSSVSLISKHHVFKEKIWLHHRRGGHSSFGGEVQCRNRISCNGPRSLCTTMFEYYFGRFEN